MLPDLLRGGMIWEELSVFTGASVSELRRLSHLHPIFLPRSMGLSHSQCVAQPLHLGILYRHTSPGPSELLHDRAPVPKSERMFSVVCDNLFALLRSKAAAVALSRELDYAYEAAGLQRHTKKDIVGELQGDWVGVRFHGEGKLGPKPQGLVKVYRATLEALTRTLVSPHATGRLVGNWTWLLMPWRPGLVVPDKCMRLCTVRAGAPPGPLVMSDKSSCFCCACAR
jgi:hypothetical protein